jgi:hypothetical protein
MVRVLRSGVRSDYARIPFQDRLSLGAAEACINQYEQAIRAHVSIQQINRIFRNSQRRQRFAVLVQTL